MRSKTAKNCRKKTLCREFDWNEKKRIRKHLVINKILILLKCSISVSLCCIYRFCMCLRVPQWTALSCNQHCIHAVLPWKCFEPMGCENHQSSSEWCSRSGLEVCVHHQLPRNSLQCFVSPCWAWNSTQLLPCRPRCWLWLPFAPFYKLQSFPVQMVLVLLLQFHLDCVLSLTLPVTDC